MITTIVVVTKTLEKLNLVSHERYCCCKMDFEEGKIITLPQNLLCHDIETLFLVLVLPLIQFDFDSYGFTMKSIYSSGNEVYNSKVANQINSVKLFWVCSSHIVTQKMKNTYRTQILYVLHCFHN